MLRSIWMHPWDLDEPERVLDRLQEHGLNACHLAVCYHGGRMLNPRRRRVVDHGLGASYLPLTIGLLAPPVIDYSALIEPFMAAAQDRAFHVHAWIVLGHRDNLPSECPYVPINCWGDRYGYALCPSRQQVRSHYAELTRALMRAAPFATAQVEAAGFMGYQHQGLHEKAGIVVGKESEWLLSVCCCHECVRGYGLPVQCLVTKALEEFPDSTDQQGDWRKNIEHAIGDQATEAILRHRESVQEELIATLPQPLCLRTANDRWFVGGKSTLSLEQSAKYATSASLTWFGMPIERMLAEIAAIKHKPLPVYGGFVFHGPDCRSQEDFMTRYEAVASKLDGVIMYCYGMAGDRHWHWLKDVR